MVDRARAEADRGLMFVNLTQDTVTPELQRILATGKRPRALMEAGAKTVQKEISDHLRKLQARGNKKGWPSQKFFSGRPTSVERNVGISSITGLGFTVTIADPRFAHRIEGGKITPKRAKYLAIPLTAEAYAKSGKGSIRESMPGLFVVKFKRGLYLVKEVAERVKAKLFRARNLDYGREVGGEGIAGGKKKFTYIKRLRVFPMFKLVKSVTHRAHPEELPDRTKLAAAAEAAMREAARLLFHAE